MSAVVLERLLQHARAPFHVEYAGTDLVDADTDGDGVRDGADDQDHDDVPNLMELSRKRPPGVRSTIRRPRRTRATRRSRCGRVNPFNPCLPDPQLADLPDLHPLRDGAWAPFDGLPYDSEGDDPDYLVLN